MSPNLGTTFTLFKQEEQEAPIFSGLVESVSLLTEDGIDYFEVEVISLSILLDKKKKKRSFQNVNMTNY